MAETKTNLTSRAVDITIAILVLVLFNEGYAKLRHYGHTRNSVAEPLMILGAFIAALHPFRLHTRIIWLVLVPFGAALIPVLGYNVRMRLTSAPGYEMPSSLASLAMFSIIFFVSTAVWLLPACLGWRVQTGTVKHSNSQTMGLKELFAITGIACVLLVFFRDSFLSENPENRMGSIGMSGVFFWMSRPANGLFIILVGAGFYFNWRIAIVVAVLAFLVASMFEWHQAHDAAMAAQRSAQRRIQLSGIPISLTAYEVPYYRVATRHAWQITVLGAAILAGRLAGYRFVRKSGSPAVGNQ